MFHWHSFDLTSRLPENWEHDIISCAQVRSAIKMLTPTSVTSREAKDVREIRVATVGGIDVKRELPWLYELYGNEILELANRCFREPVLPANDVRYSVNLNYQFGQDMRYEAHIDSNPVEALLYATDHSMDDGGELVVSNKPHVWGVKDIKADCTRIWPRKGQLVFFDARTHSHFVEPLKKADGIRVVAAMNFYTPSCSEADRPADLDKHLGIV